MSIRKCDQLLAEGGFRTVSNRDIPIERIDWPLKFAGSHELWISSVERAPCPGGKSLEAAETRAIGA